MIGGALCLAEAALWGRKQAALPSLGHGKAVSWLTSAIEIKDSVA